MAIKADSSLNEISRHLSGIYDESNGRNFSPDAMASRIERYVTRIMKAFRKGKTEQIPEFIPGALSWTLALARRMTIDAEKLLWEKFPGVCPYCGGQPCECGSGRATRRYSFDGLLIRTPAPKSLAESQVLLNKIYPNNTLTDTVIHLGEESGELGEAIENYNGYRVPSTFAKIEEELIDVIANLLAVSSCLDNAPAVSHLTVTEFGNGCPVCSQHKCRCGFTIATEHAHSTPIG